MCRILAAADAMACLGCCARVVFVSRCLECGAASTSHITWWCSGAREQRMSQNHVAALRMSHRPFVRMLGRRPSICLGSSSHPQGLATVAPKAVAGCVPNTPFVTKEHVADRRLRHVVVCLRAVVWGWKCGATNVYCVPAFTSPGRHSSACLGSSSHP